MPGDVAVLLRDARRQQRTLFRRKPVRVFDTVLEHLQHDASEHDARQAPDQEQPVPAAHGQNAVHVGQHEPRDRRPEQARERRREEQHRGDAPTIGRRKPQRQVIQHAGRKPGLHRADQEAQRVELPLRLYEGHQRRGDPPRHHDAGDPAARADLVEHEVARHLEQHVADHEEARAQPVGGVAQAKVGLQ
jgi:hypothetical protein